MRCIRFFLFLLVFQPFTGSAQTMTYTEYNKKDSRDMFFEVIGKFNGNFLIYKNITRKHSITKYDANMKVLTQSDLDFVPDRTINVDFVAYPDYLFIIYQYQKNGIVYCDAARIDADGNKVGEPRQLDTTKIGFFADNKIYSTTYSEDKQKILLYKRHIKNDNITIATKLFDNGLNQIDSSRQFLRYDERREAYSELSVANNGSFLFSKETRKSSWDNASSLDVVVKKQQSDTFIYHNISLQKKFVEEVSIKIDNLNRNFLVNSFYYGTRRGSVEGLFTAMLDMDGKDPIKGAFNRFSDSLRIKINSSEQYKFVFDNLSPRNIIIKKNGGFIIVAEDFYTETLNSNNAWNRNYWNNTLPYSNYNDYFLSNPYYYGYRPFNSFNRDISTRFYYDDIVIASIDSSLNLVWNDIIHKKQYDVDNDNFLSYSLMNVGGELHFLFIDKDKQKEIISNHSVSPSGEIKRYPTLKSNERGYTFMPKLGKQVGARQMIIPYIYLNRIGFAKVDF